MKEILMEVIRREKQAGIHPDSDLDTYMKVNCDASNALSKDRTTHRRSIMPKKKIMFQKREVFFFFQIDLQRKLS